MHEIWFSMLKCLREIWKKIFEKKNWKISLDPENITKCMEEHKKAAQNTDVMNKLNDKVNIKLDPEIIKWMQKDLSENLQFETKKIEHTLKSGQSETLDAPFLKVVKQKLDNQINKDVTDIKEVEGKIMDGKNKLCKSSKSNPLKMVDQRVESSKIQADIEQAGNKNIEEIQKAKTSLTKLLEDTDADKISLDIKAMKKSKRKYLLLPMAKHLAVLDFDHTIINDNSDIMVMNMVDKKYIPKEVKDLYKCDGWTVFMQRVFEILYQNNIPEDSINELIKKLPAVCGMSELIKELNLNCNYDVIVISDSNSHFIDTWLDANGLAKNISEVFTNPAKFENGMLKIQMYHVQDSCKLSTRNLCKGQVLDEFIEKQKMKDIQYETVIYCGDGLHDFCPILRLSENDVACVRDKYKLLDLVQKAQKGQYLDDNGIVKNLKCDVCVWNTGYDILDFLKQKNKRCVAKCI
ncbi:unnamed protein product [Callosobruchus maculatus]|uniref:Uncharacterized protein n=1 Tax=Callosobruchus maculatus TaxID=64391 RepID=A0A653DCC9_CALMS|nr:unnamed protein product [Callosobruchus maculatus]